MAWRARKIIGSTPRLPLLPVGDVSIEVPFWGSATDGTAVAAGMSGGDGSEAAGARYPAPRTPATPRYLTRARKTGVIARACKVSRGLSV